MLKPISAIIKDSIGNIIFRGNVVTGTVAVVRGNGSYDVFISESDRAYPKIFTLSRNPDLAVGDKVRILYKNGCKELPIILPPTISIGANIIFVMYQDYAGNNFIKTYNSNGTLITSWAMPTGYYETNCICVDSSNNIYINYGTSIVKRDSSGNILLAKTGIDSADAIAIGADGYIYTREDWGGDDVLVKRNTSDLDSVSHIALYNKNWYGLAFDSNNNFYMCSFTDNRMEKWQYTDYGRIITKIINTAGADDSGLCIVGNTISMAAGIQKAFTMPTDLSTNESDFYLGKIEDYVYGTPASLGNSYLFVGDYLGTHLVMQSYNSSRLLVWQINVTNPGSNTVDSAAVTAYPF